MLSRLLRLLRTLRHLKPVQIYGRALFRLRRPRPDFSPPPPPRSAPGAWRRPAERPPRMDGPWSFRLLNETHDIRSPLDWNREDRTKLWLYNLHYFEDLLAEGAEQRVAWHRELIGRWIVENPPTFGNGWEPYPLSQRIVNWIKWARGGQRLEASWLASLAVQARYLERRLEHHLQGNHLFVNGKALVAAGLFFEGSEAERWLARGSALVEREVAEQVLADGGCYELSPMYHCLLLEDLLDLVNLYRALGLAAPGAIERVIPAMLRWLAATCHPDGQIGFFNDAAFGVAPAPREIARYAGELGFAAEEERFGGLLDLPQSGYFRVEHEGIVALIDAAALGPDHVTGHAHADTLSFELSLAGRRLFVNSGTSVYGVGAERMRQRGTAAHSTVVVDRQDSSEVWGGFRVARRARVLDRQVRRRRAGFEVEAAHTGYRRLPGRPLHRRTWDFEGAELRIVDEVSGSGAHDVELLFHVHPDWSVERLGAHEIGFELGGRRARVELDRSMDWSIEGSSYHPEFGLSVANVKLAGRKRGRCPIRFVSRLRW